MLGAFGGVVSLSTESSSGPSGILAHEDDAERSVCDAELDRLCGFRFVCVDERDGLPVDCVGCFTDGGA